MSLTSAQRGQICRENARKSTGPKTIEGKLRSRQNALKHGLRAETLALPDEDPAALAAREQEWKNHYITQGPGEAALIDQAVRATLTLDRCAKLTAATLSKQMRHALLDWDKTRRKEINGWVALLGTDAPTAALELRSTSQGCLWLIEQWTKLAEKLAEGSEWSEHDRALALRLDGVNPEKGYPAHSLAHWDSKRSRVERQPVVERGPILRDWKFPGEEPRYDYRPIWKAQVERCLAELIPRAEMLRLEFDEPDRADASTCALAIADPKLASLILRYQNAAQSAFFRAYVALEKIRELDRVPADFEENPNEPNRADEEQVSSSGDKTCVDPGAAVPGPSPASGPAPVVVKPAPKPQPVDRALIAALTVAYSDPIPPSKPSRRA